jgi:hypothetical protein
MALDTEVESYLSPPGKLLRLFKRGRDAWKRKCGEAKAKIKLLANRVRSLLRSRDRWKHLAKQRKEQLRELRRQLDLEKKSTC